MKRDLPAALAQSHNTVTVSSRAIDVGYANTKFTVGRKKVNGETVIVADLFPSITAVLPKGRPFERKAGTRASDGCLTEIDGVLHFAGRGVPMHLKGSQPRHVLPNYCMTPAYMALMHGAMHYMLEDVGNTRSTPFVRSAPLSHSDQTCDQFGQRSACSRFEARRSIAPNADSARCRSRCQRA